MRQPLSSTLAAAIATVLGATLFVEAQQQAPDARAGWPCGGRLDLSYFRVAEGSGGHLLMLAPEELGDSATLLTAFDAHPHTLFRTAGSMQPGLHEFPVVVDRSIESVLFSFAVQCLQTVDVVRPSGAPAIGDDVTDFANFRAERMVIVRRPEPGTWTLRVSGSGISGVVVQAQSALGISAVDFATSSTPRFAAVPRAGVENVVRIRMGGGPSDVRATLVNGTFERLADLPLSRDEAEQAFISRFTAGTTPFRVLVTGTDAAGNPFQRVSGPLLTPTR